MWQQLLAQIKRRDIKALARAISLVENEHDGYEAFLASLPVHDQTRIIGITGPPGAGKSTLVDGLIGEMIHAGKKIAVLCVDPSSPFNLGALLGDRVRMSQWYTHPDVFIRSLATRGSMGGLHPKIIEISELVKSAGFDHLIIETVGVGQSEIEIAGLADLTVVVLVPEAGDEVQTMKAGLMEIADVFVVNKADRPDADLFVKNLKQMLAPAFSSKRKEVAVIKTFANEGKGIRELFDFIENDQHSLASEKKIWLFTEKTFQLIQKQKMKDVNRNEIARSVEQKLKEGDFNLYQFTSDYLQNK